MEDLHKKLRRRRSSSSSSRSRRVVEVEVEDCVDLRTTRRQREITKKMNEVIENSLKTDWVVVNSYHIRIRKEDLFCLTRTNWLNDSVIDFYLKMIEDRSGKENYQAAGMPKVYAMSTYSLQSSMLQGPSALQSALFLWLCSNCFPQSLPDIICYSRHHPSWWLSSAVHHSPTKTPIVFFILVLHEQYTFWDFCHSSRKQHLHDDHLTME